MNKNLFLNEDKNLIANDLVDTTIYTDASASKLADFLMRHNQKCENNKNSNIEYKKQKF